MEKRCLTIYWCSCRNGLCAKRRCETEDPKRHAYNDFTAPTPLPQCQDAYVRPKWCLHDAGMRDRKAGNPQLASDSATSFTSLSRFFSHTCDNQSRVALHALAGQESCTLHCACTIPAQVQRQSGPVAVLGRTYHHRNPKF